MPRPKNKDEYRAELAETFAHILEEQGLNWKKEWHGQGINAPYNAVTKAHYRGINAFWLSLVSMAKGYTDPRWVTMVQIMDNDGKYHPKESWHLKKGSKAAYVEYWYPYDLKEKKAVTWKQYKDALKDGRTEAEFKLSSRYYAVFNAQNVEGMPPLEVKQVQSVPIDQLVQTLSQNMGVPVFTDGGDRAYYSPGRDEIHLPKPESFFSEYAFNSTALHELAHSTGHASRLNRDLSGGFGSQAYAYEELVAEMCSAFMSADLAAEATQEHIENHKAYVQSWIQAIREKPETLVKAIKDAQEAAAYMDSQAELIPEEENRKVVESAMEISEEKIRTPEKQQPKPEQNELTVLVVEPGKVPYPKQIPDTLQSLRKEVGGYIEAVYPFKDPVCVICNEEAKPEGLPLNRSLRDEQGQIYDIVAGTFLVAGLGEENFTSLSPELLDKYSRHFAMPEMFASLGGKIISMPMQEPLREAPLADMEIEMGN